MIDQQIGRELGVRPSDRSRQRNSYCYVLSGISFYIDAVALRRA